MDKSWMDEARTSKKFEVGLDKFLKFAKSNASDKNKIYCPCSKCSNTAMFSIGVIKDHIYFNGIDRSYKNWKWHGEPSRSYISSHKLGNTETCGESSVNRKIDEGEHEVDMGIPEDEVEQEVSDGEEFVDAGFEFMKLVDDADKPIYPGCVRNTKLNVLIRSFNLKAKHGMSDSCYSDWLMFLNELLPEGNEIPGTFYAAKKTLCALGLDYEKYHCCHNDCIVYRKQHSDALSCPTCGESRWKLDKDDNERVGVPAKVMWFLPPIPRFRRMFSSPTTAEDLTWHEHGRKKDGVMRHPADSPTWSLADTRYPVFGAEPRNLRLGLSTDGFNPHSEKKSKYSCWPVILVTYNLPPSLCMKRKYMLLTMLISGPKQPGTDIDVYLEVLVDHLQIFWEGVDGVYDAARGEYFRMRGMLLCTINDFPAYGNLSGSIVKGYHGCPICVENTGAYHLKHSRKMSYMRTRRHLPRHHPYRNKPALFDNTVEEDLAPRPISGEEVLERVEGLNYNFGKKSHHPTFKGQEGEERPCWKKKSIFFQLEYWKYFPVRHNLDVMHIEKNVCEALIGTLMNIPNKTKDSGPARQDLAEMGVRVGLAPVDGVKKKDSLPMATWNFTLDEKRIVCRSLFNMRVPTCFSSNIRNLVSMEDLRLVGLKSHDCHILMQVLLPVALRSVLEKPVRIAIIRFCLFFKAICAKEIDVPKLVDMQADLVKTVCMLEMYFPPSFFDIMIHLTVHLVREVELCGPVFFRWMYPFERYMKVFKGYVRNRHRPEGCIIESYIVEEAVEFNAERMLASKSTVGNRDTTKPGLIDGCKPLGGYNSKCLTTKERDQAHLCVLQNTNEVLPYFTEHMELMKLVYPKFRKNTKWLLKKQNEEFAEWFKQRVSDGLEVSEVGISETVRWLADGPRYSVATYSGYHIHGVDFYTKKLDKTRSVQNSGVFVVGSAMQVSSAKDKNPIIQDMNYYGVIQDIWELDYYKLRVPLFQCDWVENARGVKVDDCFGYTLVKLSRKGHLGDPYVLGTQVKQIFYLEDPLDPLWYVVCRCPNKDYKGAEYDDEMEDVIMEDELVNSRLPEVEAEEVDYMRDVEERIWIED